MRNDYLARLKDVCTHRGWNMAELVRALESDLVQEEIQLQIENIRENT